MNNSTQLIEIFRAGTHTAMSGERLNFSEEDLQNIADGYDPDVAEAPVVIGHPKTDDPAYGWVDKLVVIGGLLLAFLKHLDPEFSECVRSGKYRKVSASFFSPDAPANPRKGQWYLRHVGFLGAAAPAVSGLKPVSFRGSEQEILTFSEIVETPNFQASFSERQKNLSRRENEIFLEKMIGEGRFLPVHKEGALSFMEAIEDARAVSFSENDETVTAQSVEWFKKFIRRQPKCVTFGEMPQEQARYVAAMSADLSFTAPSKRVIDPESLDLHQEILTETQRSGSSYEAALERVL